MISDRLRTNPKSEIFFMLLIVILHAVYFLSAITIAEPITPDSDEYLKMAENVIQHFTFYDGKFISPLREELYSLRPPLYGIFILITSFGMKWPFLTLFVQNVLSLILWINVAGFVKKYSSTKHVYLWIFLTLVLFPTQLILVNQYMADFLLEFIFLMAFFSFLHYTEKRNIKYWYWFNILLALGVLTKPVLLFFWLPVLGFTLYFFIKDRNWQLWLAIVLLPLVILSWSYRNYRETGVFEYTSLTHQLALEANVQQIYLSKYGNGYARPAFDSLRRHAAEIPVYSERIAFIHGIERSVVSENPLTFVLLNIKGSVNSLLNPGRVDINIFFKIKPEKEAGFFNGFIGKGIAGILEYFSTLNLALISFLAVSALYQLILLIGFVYSLVYGTQLSPTTKMYILICSLYALAVPGIIGYARFKLLILPFLVMGLILFFDRIKSAFYKKSSN